MWHLVQQDPGESVLLGSYIDYEKAMQVLINKQRFNAHCFYEIMHSNDIKAMNSKCLFPSPN